ncbi:MAG: hypothetical protein KOO63_14605, partial [Bacteroidales bacterium]|nr:hypothetical protein [Candidatus Latescibacterota bacterium]
MFINYLSAHIPSLGKQVNLKTAFAHRIRMSYVVGRKIFDFHAKDQGSLKSLFINVLLAVLSLNIHFSFKYSVPVGILCGDGMESQFFRRRNLQHEDQKHFM